MAQAGSLMTETLKLLKERSQTLPTISADTGINFYWLRKFISGEVEDPSVNRVQLLWEYLAGRKLPVSTSIEYQIRKELEL